MNNNNFYWIDREQRSKIAKEHTKEMNEYYSSDIAKSVSESVIYTGKATGNSMIDGDIEFIIEDSGSVNAIFEHAIGKTCVLNFASYKSPGGMFIEGSRAQEECLCHDSFLYNVLKQFPKYYAYNNGRKNNSLYTNRAIYSPDITFFRTMSNGEKEAIFCDVLTCAAPNYSTACTYGGVSYEDNLKALRSRIKFVVSILKEQGVETAILGAFGCGVFGQDATEVANIFVNEIKSQMNGKMFTAVFAVPSGVDGNYKKMKEVIESINEN